MAVKTGQSAPGFTLYDSEKNKVSIENFRGRNVVLLFFPQSFTGTCTTELCAVRDDISAYHKLDAEVLAISVDSLFTHAKYKEVYNLNFRLLSDFNKEVSAAYGTLYDEFAFGMKGVSKRSAFAVDKEGIIRYAEVLEKATDVPSLDAVKKTLTQLQEEKVS